ERKPPPATSALATTRQVLARWRSAGLVRFSTAKHRRSSRKSPRGKQGPQGIRVWSRSQRFLAYRPCAATITGKETESAKAQRTAVRRDDGLDYGSSADPDAHREDRSQKHEIHFVKWRAG